MNKKISTVIAGTLLASSSAMAIDLEQMQIFGYGTMSFSNYDYLQNYQQDPKNRSKVDFERFVLSPRFLLSDTIKLVSEIEFEHGGTGVTVEYDTLDEFGEFETEIEKGGEVIIEEAYIDITKKPGLNWRVGHMVIPVGLNSQRHLPNLYLSTQRNISETSILPDTWHETGVMAYGKLGKKLNYQAMLMTGLNSEFFNSAHWIKAGHQKRFESVNADDLAVAIRADYGDLTGSHIGASLYFGNTNQNRNKSQLSSAGTVTIMDIHGVYDKGNLKLRGMALLGTLSDSEAITLANKSLPSALEAKKSPVGSQALAYFVEAGYDIAPKLGHGKGIIPFVKYDYVDSMYKTEGSVPDLDRFERSTVTLGVNYVYSPSVTFKTDYSRTSTADKNIKDLDAFTLAVGYQF